MNNFRRCFALFVLTLSLAASCRASLTITPTELSVKSSGRGQSSVQEIEIHNPGETPLHVGTSIVDWTLSPSGDYEFAAPGSLADSAAPWIQVRPAEFSVAPQGSIRVRVSIAPTGSVTREYRSMVFFHSHMTPPKGAPMGLQMILRVGCNVFVAPAKTPSPRLQITRMEAKNGPLPIVEPAANKPVPPGKAYALFVLKNDGASSTRVSGTVTVKDGAGVVVAEGPMQAPNSRVLPMSERVVWLKLEQPLAPGKYHVHLKAEYGTSEAIFGDLEVNIPGTAGAAAAGAQ